LQPLEHEANRAFAADLRNGSKLTNRLYVWDYVTNFSLLLQQRRTTGQAEWFPRSRTEYCSDYVRVCREHGVDPKHITPWETILISIAGLAPLLTPRLRWRRMRARVGFSFAGRAWPP
jgi:hypothetical protein